MLLRFRPKHGRYDMERSQCQRRRFRYIPSFPATPEHIIRYSVGCLWDPDEKESESGIITFSDPTDNPLNNED